MSKKLLEVLPTLQSFKDNVIIPLTNMFNGAEWLNDATSYTKQETIYRLLILKYGDRQIRYDDTNIFLNRLVFDLADLLPDIYAKQQVFIKNKLNEFLSDNKNRAIIIDNETTNTRDSDSNSKLGNSSSPLNLVIDSAEQIQQAPITSSNLSNVKLVENYNGNNQQVNYNFVNDLVKTLNANYSLRLNEFMELLGKHFVNVVGSFYRPKQCNNETIKNELYRFNNGYLVNEVDYLGATNKQEIDRFNVKLEDLNNQVATKQNQLIAGDNITIENNVISASGNGSNVDLSNYYTKQEVNEKCRLLDNKIFNNYSDIQGLTVKFNEYYNKQEVDTQQQQQDTLITKNKQDIQDLWTELVRTNNVINENATNITINTTSIERIEEEQKTQNQNISNNRNDINNLNNKIDDYKKTEILNNATTITDLGNDKVMVIAQMNISNYRNNGQDLYQGFPTEVKNLNNVRQIEYFEYNFIQYTNEVNKVFTNYVGNIAASVYQNRIYLRNEMAIPTYVNYLRFKIVYDKS